MHADLAAVCDALIPAVDEAHDTEGYWARCASDQGVAERIIELMRTVKEEDKLAFDQLLGLLSSPLLGLTWMGPLKPARRLRPAQLEKMLQRWSVSRIAMLRQAFNTLRKLTALIYYGDVPAGSSVNPNWNTLGYEPLPSVERNFPQPLPVSVPDKDCVLHCEVLVIGSGAGGSIVAAELAAAGHDVLVVEKGVYTPPQAFTTQEYPMFHRHFEAGALLASQNGSIAVLAGSTLGGGTTINWAGALRTPDDVLDEWGRQHGNALFLENDYRRGFEAVEQRTHVSTGYRHNPPNKHLRDSARRFGYLADDIPMNIRMPEDMPEEMAWQAAGFSCLGDRFGIKQGANETFLRDAVQAGARLLTQTQINKITVQNGAATGATGFASQPDGRQVSVEIKAGKVVLSAGALHTPVLLLKSGLSHPQIGENLYLHPVAPVAAFFQRETVPWHGPMMSVVLHQFARIGEGWGFRLETPPIHPGLAAFALNWENGAFFKRDMASIRHLAVHICLVRDRYGGRVTVGERSGQPLIHYQLHPFDRHHVIRGVQESVRMHALARAARITVLHNKPEHFYLNHDDEDAFIAKIPHMKWEPNYFNLFSAHQMGTARMGGNANYPVKPNGETREVRQLFVVDTSLFPSASGVNPMLSVQALAWNLAQGMK